MPDSDQPCSASGVLHQEAQPIRMQINSWRAHRRLRQVIASLTVLAKKEISGRVHPGRLL